MEVQLTPRLSRSEMKMVSYRTFYTWPLVVYSLACQKKNQITPALIAHIKEKVALASAKTGTKPSVMVMGALGRCGTGACDFATKAGINDTDIIRWDMAETKAGGPYPTILAHSIFVNCIYLSSPIAPFITPEVLTPNTDAERHCPQTDCDF
jgi:saccharopine dehydrogenase (NAD+, L-lysine forming)